MKRTVVLILAISFFGFISMTAQAASLSGGLLPPPPPTTSKSEPAPMLVPPPLGKKCDGSALSIKNFKVGPEKLWAPTAQEINIEVSGTAVASPGCGVKGHYKMETLEGPITGGLVLDEKGDFDQKVTVTLAKKGNEKEGVVYEGALSLEDEDGNKVSQGFFVKVDHDRGKK